MITELWVYFNFSKRPPSNRASRVARRKSRYATFNQLSQKQSTESATRHSQIALFKIKWQ